MTIRTVYADNNATTRVAPEVLEAMLPFFKDQFGNPSSMHYLAKPAEQAITKAREQVASILKAEQKVIMQQFAACWLHCLIKSIS
jgi:cysteine desulfurase